jgi:MarR-like DNA-binding transcriptional regulator SgrR of sgrS sRNA
MKRFADQKRGLQDAAMRCWLVPLLGLVLPLLLAVPGAQGGRLPRYGGNVRVELNEIPTDLFPYRLAGDPGELVGSNIYEGLTAFSGRGIVPSLAATWVKSDDERRWVFRLRPDVYFHDGTPCNAAAVVASLNRLAHSEESSHQWLLREVEGWKAFQNGQVPALEGIVAAEDNEIEFHLQTPVPDLDVRLALPQAAIARWNDRTMVGTGPYRVVSGNEEALRLVAFEAYWGGRPFLDGLDLVRNPEAAVTPWGSDANMKRVLPTHPIAADAQRVETRTSRLGFALVHPVSKVLRTRRARLRAGIGFDREVFAQASLNGKGEAAFGLLPGQRDLPQQDTEDVEGDLMLQPRSSLRILVRRGEPVLERLGERLQVHLFASGFDARLDVLPSDEYNVALLTEEFDILLLGWTPPLSAGRRLREDTLVRHVLTHVLEPALLDRLPQTWSDILRKQVPATRSALFEDGYLIPLVRYHETWELSQRVGNAQPGYNAASLGLVQAHLRPTP